MSVSVYANPVVRGMAGFYTTTFLSAAWSDDHSHDSRARPIFQYNRRWCGADRDCVRYRQVYRDDYRREWSSTAWERESPLWAAIFNPGVPFLVYAPLLVFSAALLAMVGKETLDQNGTR